MPEEPSPPSTRQSPESRPPVPGWLWLLFAFGLVPVGTLLCAVASHGQPNQIGQAAMIGFIGGLVLGVPMLCGLALAARYHSDTGSRIGMGLFFAFLCAIGFAGVIFAGCMCLMNGAKFNH